MSGVSLAVLSDPCRGSWLSTLPMSLPRLIWSDPCRGSWLSTPQMSSRCRFRSSFGVIPVEDGGCRLPGVDSRGNFDGDSIIQASAKAGRAAFLI